MRRLLPECFGHLRRKKMKRSKRQAEQPVGNKKLRQCVIGRTNGNVLDVVGLDGWLGKGATITKSARVLKNCSLEKLIIFVNFFKFGCFQTSELNPVEKIISQKKLDFYFKTVKTNHVAAPDEECNDLKGIETDEPACLAEAPIENDLRPNLCSVSKDRSEKCKQQAATIGRQLVPSFEDEDFDFAPINENIYSVQRTSPREKPSSASNVDVTKNEILTLDD